MKTKNNKSDILKIGWYQIIGGILGVLFILYSLLRPIQVSGYEALIYIVIFLLYGYSIFCGTHCIMYKKNALMHSLINQFLQLIGFAFLGFAFTYVAGFYISIGLDFSNSIEFKLNFGLSTIDFNLNREYDRTEIRLNLIALGLLYWIDSISTKIEEDADKAAQLEKLILPDNETEKATDLN